MEEQHERIIEESMGLFLKYGVRSITMDDVSRDLGISKKTLYKFVSNKADLITQGVKSKYGQITELISGLSEKAENAIDELFEIDLFFDQMMREQHPAMMFQLSKYYPETFKWLSNEKVAFVLSTTTKNLNRGIKEGLYRTDFNVDYISYIYVAHTNLVESDSGVPKEICESSDFHKCHLQYHIRGIASEKGLNYLNEKLNK